MGNTPRVLFICQHNSGRSQIAEAYLKKLAGGQIFVESAGLEPSAGVNPLVVQVMQEDGLDVSQQKPQSVFELFKQGKLYDHVITVCHDGEAQCPIFPGITKRWHVPFPDPAEVQGSEAEKLNQVRKIRDMVKDWLQSPAEGQFSYHDLVS